MVRTQHEISDTSTVIIDSFTLSFDLSQHRRRDQNIASTFAESSSKLRWRHTRWNLLFLFSSFLHYVSSLRKKNVLSRQATAGHEKIQPRPPTINRAHFKLVRPSWLSSTKQISPFVPGVRDLYFEQHDLLLIVASSPRSWSWNYSRRLSVTAHVPWPKPTRNMSDRHATWRKGFMR